MSRNKIEKIINHVALVLDSSYSMRNLGNSVVKVVEGIITDLAQLSKDMRQETRVTVYTFASEVDCIVYDQDVHGLMLEMDIIRNSYKVDGNTALLRATSDAIDDLKLTATKYGNHSFLLYVITDGEENVSDGDPWQVKGYRLPPGQKSFRVTLPAKLAELQDNWTMACFVPSERHIDQAKSFGFPEGNIAVWDATSVKGMQAAGKTITAATTSYMTSRATGTRGTKNLFTPNVAQLDTAKVTEAGLTPLDIGKYALIPVNEKTTIQAFVEKATSQYQVGRAFYQLTGSDTPKGKKRIEVQGNKAVAVVHKHTSKVYTGPEARKLVGLPDHTVMVDPKDEKGDWLLFVQSQSVNRHLYPGTRLLLLLG